MTLRARRRPRWSSSPVWWSVLSVALAAAVFAVLLQLGDLDVRAVVSDLRPWPFAVAVGLEVAALVCLGRVYRAVLVAMGGDIAVWPATRLALSAFGIAQVLPGGGAVAAVYVARQLHRRHGADPVRAAGTSVVFGIVTMGTLGALASLAAALAAITHLTSAASAWIAGLGTAAMVGSLVVLRVLLSRGAVRRLILRVVDRPTARSSPDLPWERALDELVETLARPGRFARAVGWSGVNWSLDASVLAVVGWTVGLDVSVLAIIVAYAMGNLLNGLPLTPGGIGLVEAGLVGTLIAFGADPGLAGLTAVAYRLTAHWLPMLVAAPLAVSELHAARHAQVAA